MESEDDLDTNDSGKVDLQLDVLDEDIAELEKDLDLDDYPQTSKPRTGICKLTCFISNRVYRNRTRIFHKING